MRAAKLPPAAQVAASVGGGCRRRPGSAPGRQPCKGQRGCSVPSSFAVRIPAARASLSWTAGCGVEKGPRGSQLARSGGLAPPCPGISKPPSGARRRHGGRDWAPREAGRDLEKPPRLHCSGRGLLEEPVSLSHLPSGLSRCAVPRCSAQPGPEGAGPGAWLRWGAPERVRRGPEVQRRATTVSEKVVRKFREVLLRPSFQAFGVRINRLYSAFRELRT